MPEDTDTTNEEDSTLDFEGDGDKYTMSNDTPDTHITRRTIIKSLGVVPVSGYVLSDESESPPDKDFECGGLIESDDEAEPLSGEPDFYVEQETPVYWKPKQHFENAYGNGFFIAVAYTDGRIELNKGFADVMNNHIIMHEFGHVIGYGHTDGTIMAPNSISLRDAVESGEMSQITQEIFEECDDTILCDWNEDGVAPLGDIASDYASGGTDIHTLGNAASQYARNADTTGYYKTCWNTFGDKSLVSSPQTQCFDGDFYGEYFND